VHEYSRTTRSFGGSGMFQPTVHDIKNDKEDGRKGDAKKDQPL
jgi:hypothetical protein